MGHSCGRLQMKTVYSTRNAIRINLIINSKITNTASHQYSRIRMIVLLKEALSVSSLSHTRGQPTMSVCHPVRLAVSIGVPQGRTQMGITSRESGEGAMPGWFAAPAKDQQRAAWQLLNPVQAV